MFIIVVDIEAPNILRMILQCLLLVQGGFSERSSVDTVVTEPSKKLQVLHSVLEIVSRQDKLDRTVKKILDQDGIRSQDRIFFRLSSYVLSRSEDKGELERKIRSLREIVDPKLSHDLEWIIGIASSSKTESPLDRINDEERIAEVTSNQAWWVRYCYQLFGRDEAIKFLSTIDRPQYVHANPIRNNGDWNLNAEQAQDQVFEETSVEHVFRLKKHPSILSQQFSRGLFQIQDLASFLAVKAANPLKGETALDICAATGSKTCTLAQFMMNTGRIVSVDTSRARFQGWKKQVMRMGVSIAEPVIADAMQLGIRNSFDLVIVDPPCSGSGVFDRNPRMKWYVSPLSLSRYSQLQQTILNEAAKLVRPEGRIVYGTCSITIEENEMVISRFLKAHPKFQTRPILQHEGSNGYNGFSDCRRFYPHRDATAGYFIARLEQAS